MNHYMEPEKSCLLHHYPQAYYRINFFRRAAVKQLAALHKWHELWKTHEIKPNIAFKGNRLSTELTLRLVVMIEKYMQFWGPLTSETERVFSSGQINSTRVINIINSPWRIMRAKCVDQSCFFGSSIVNSNNCQVWNAKGKQLLWD